MKNNDNLNNNNNNNNLGQNEENETYETNELSLQVMIGKYLQHLQIKNYSPETIKARGKNLKYLQVWCSDRRIEKVTEIRKEHLVSWQEWIYERVGFRGEPMMPQTRANVLTGVRMFFQFLARQNYIENNVASEIELPKLVPRFIPKVFKIEEVELMLSQIDISKECGLRDRAMLELCYSTGIRLKEILSLKVGDFDFHRGMLRIEKGKGGYQRVIPFGERAQAWIEKYLEESRPKLVIGEDTGEMFLSKNGTVISKTRFGEMIRECKQKIGIEIKGASHLFRHTMATLMLEAGADIRYIQQMLGHQSLKNTQVYTHVTDFKLKQVHSQTHPGAKLPKVKPDYSRNNITITSKQHLEIEPEIESKIKLKIESDIEEQ